MGVRVFQSQIVYRFNAALLRPVWRRKNDSVRGPGLMLQRVFTSRLTRPLLAVSQAHPMGNPFGAL